MRVSYVFILFYLTNLHSTTCCGPGTRHRGTNNMMPGPPVQGVATQRVGLSPRRASGSPGEVTGNAAASPLAPESAVIGRQ